MAESSRPKSTLRTALYIQLAAIIGFVIAAVIAHLLASPDYDWTQHALSGLAGQNTYRPRTMRFGFLGLGVGVGLGIMYKLDALGTRPLKDILLGVYAICTIGLGIFRSAPYTDYPYYSVLEASLHSTFGNLSGVALMVAMVVYGLNAPDRRWKIIHFGGLALTLISFITFLLAYNGAISLPPGIVQRIVVLIGLTWLALSQIHDARSADQPAPAPE